jgi:hypothetical protein
MKIKELDGRELRVFAKFQKSQQTGDLAEFWGGRECRATL